MSNWRAQKLVAIFISGDFSFIKLFLLFDVRFVKERILSSEIHHFASCIYSFISLFIKGKFGLQGL